jgi:EAL domain-containing protein (putative c-di-GMP-specific phosphodiesterase class I)
MRTRSKRPWTWTGTERRPEGQVIEPAPVERRVRDLATTDLDVVFQPIVSLDTGKVFAYESLVRCRWPEFASPVRLFEAAVEETACGALGRKIRDVTFALGSDLPLFVNLHPKELSSRWLVRPDDPIGFHERPVYLEITESAALDFFELCMSVLKEVCHRTGASLVVDDFGAGYSNLLRIAELGPDVVKLDRELVRGLESNPRQQRLVAGVVRLCNDMGARVVAEGIETLDELLAVIDAGAELGQGYLLARPGPPGGSVFWPLG